MEIVKKMRKIISWRQNAHRWCSEAMFEYMLPNLTDPATDVHKIRRIHDFWSSNCHFESTGAASSEARPFFFGWKTIAAISSQQHHLTDQTSWYWHISTEIQNRMWSWCQKARFQIHKISSKNIKYRSLEVGNGVVQEKRSRKSWWSFPASKNCPGDRNKYLGGIVASFPSKSCRVWDREIEREGGTEREGERARKMAKGQLARFRFGVLERGMILMTAILLLRAHKADSGWLPFWDWFLKIGEWSLALTEPQ